MSCKTGGMISEPKTTPITRATCCFHGVAFTSWPVLRSWRLSFEIVAMQNTIADVNSVYAISAVFSSVVGASSVHHQNDDCP